MPELPEVETLKIQLNQFLDGLIITRIEILKPKSFKGEAKDIIGAKITGVERFGKMLVFALNNSLSLAIHLKLTGQLIYRGERQPKKILVSDPLLNTLPNKHTRVIIDFTNGDKLFFNDMRIFGWMRVVTSGKRQGESDKDTSDGGEATTSTPPRWRNQMESIDNIVEKIGPEPMNIDADKFYKIIHVSARPIKVVLMDQEKISGVGNIYANDSLFLSGIHPKTKASKLSSYQVIKLYNNLVKVLKDAIRWRGASEQHFRDALGQMGEAQKHFYVYQQDGQNCPNNCGAKIERMKLAGRGTFFCPKCQNT